MSLRGARPVVALAAAVALGAAAGQIAGSASGAADPQATSSCTTRRFAFQFDPKKSAKVVDRTTLGFASFGSRWVATTAPCRRAAQPRVYRDTPLRETRGAVRLRCTSPRPIKIHVNGIVNGDSSTGARIGNTIVVGFGEPLTVIVSAVLKNKGDPNATSIYTAAGYCRRTP
jgi:hypothetical protein